MTQTRLSHAYCRECDVVFLAAGPCPRCGGCDLISPPLGSTAPIQTPSKGRKWVAWDRNPR